MNERNERRTKVLIITSAFVVVYMIAWLWSFSQDHSVRVIDWQKCTEAKQTKNDGYMLNCLEPVEN